MTGFTLPTLEELLAGIKPLEQAKLGINLQPLRDEILAVDLSFREGNEIRLITLQRTQELLQFKDAGTLKNELTIALRKRLIRMKAHGYKQVRKDKRDALVAPALIIGQRFGCLTAMFQYKFDADIDDLNMIQHDRKWRCQCDCGRIHYRHTHHLLRSETEEGHAIRTCGKQCGLKSRTAKPVDAHAKQDSSDASLNQNAGDANAAVNDPSPKSAHGFKSPFHAAFARLHQRISDDPESPIKPPI